tara:strand:+ start:606 stop:1145 length:540 start_codon:yes stop_codon:yes gene_type:complete
MKIGFCGTVSVGKTTLVNSLKELPEFKDYESRTERSKYLRDLGIPLNTDSTIKGQTIFLAERCSELMFDNVITDRTIIDVMAFTQLSKSINQVEIGNFLSHARNLISEYDCIFYVSPEGVELEDNGVRTIDKDYRNKVDETIKDTLALYRNRIQKVITLKGTNEERIAKVKQVLFPQDK